MILTTIKDSDCKYLHPPESTDASDSDERMLNNWDNPLEKDIFAEFPKDMLTDEVHANISKASQRLPWQWSV